MTKSAESATVILGNTKPKSSKKPSENKRYCFTLNNYSSTEYEELIKCAEKHNFSYIIGKEVGEMETPHLQGYINMPTKHSLESVKKLLNNNRLHLEKCKGSEKSNAVYCSKENNFVTNIKEYMPKKALKLITNLKPWQLEIENLLQTEPDGRTLHWYWEIIGGVGKSAFCKYMYVKHKVLVIQGGKLADIMNILFNTDCDELQMIIIDIPRKNGNSLSYSAVECILNGMITNTKYETGTKVFNPPHVIVFSNEFPEKCHLSEDRWKISEITE